MQDLNLLYIHGYQSSGKSKTAEAIRLFLPKMATGLFANVNVISPDVPENPSEAIDFIQKFIADNDVTCVVGSSLGGFNVINSTFETDIPKIVINPLVDSMELINPDLNHPLHDLTQTIYKKHLVTFLFPSEENLHAVFSTNDEVLNHSTQSKRLKLYYGCKYENMVFVDDAHSLSPENIEKYVCPLILMVCVGQIKS